MTAKEKVWNGNPKLEQFLVPISKVRRLPVEENPRGLSEKDRSALKKSLGMFGQQKPIIVDKKNVIRAGNGTHESAEEFGWTHIAALKSDIDDEDQLRLYTISDNRTAELSHWQLPVLAKEMQAMKDSESVDWEELGLWEDYELDSLLNASWAPPALEPLPGTEGGSDGGPDMAKPIMCTLDQRAVIDRAIEKVKAGLSAEEGQSVELSDGRALELICGDFLAG